MLSTAVLEDCCDFPALVGHKLPFRRVVALEFGDNRAVSGLVQCACKMHHYLFQEFDSFDCGKQTIVAYGLHRVTATQFDKLVALYSQIQKPKWPVWIPPVPEQIAHEALAEIVEYELSLCQHSKLDTVIASDNIVNSVIMGSCKHNDGRRWLSAIGL